MTRRPRRVAEWLKRGLASRAAVVLAVCLGLLLSVPSLTSGFVTEDLLFRVSAAEPFDLSRVNLFDARDLADGVAEGRHHGALPWLTPDEFRISFWRPLTSLTHHLDYRVLREPFLAHLQSSLWYALSILCAFFALRSVLGRGWTAGLATVLFAVDSAHGQAVGWLSNRHIVIAAGACALALALHHRGRVQGSFAARLAAPAVFALALLASESAVGLAGYLLGYATLIDRSPGRFRSLLPHAAVLAGWAVAFVTLEHGATGSSLYVDPVRDPLAFLVVLPERLGVLLLAQLGEPSAELWHLVSGPSRALLGCLGYALVAACVALAARPRVALFCALGAALALLPAVATFPSDRSLWLSGIGGFGLVALVVERATVVASPARMLGVALLVVHGLAAPFAFPERSLLMKRLHDDVVRASDSAYDDLPGEVQRLVVVTSHDFYFCKLLYELRWSRQLPSKPLTCLTGSLGPVLFERVDPNALRVTVPAGYLDRPFNRLYRDATHPMRVDQSVFVGASSVTVEQVDAQGAPVTAVFRFVVPLESNKLAFRRFEGGALVPWSPPAWGDTTQLE